MKWPPQSPSESDMTDALGVLIDAAQELLLQEEDMTSRERAIAENMRHGNTTFALIEDNERAGALTASLEITRRQRFRSFTVLSGSPVLVHFGLPTRITHAAVNEMNKGRALILADLAVRDFVDGLLEQQEFAKTAGADADELRSLEPSLYMNRLKKIHRLMRMRQLPLF